MEQWNYLQLLFVLMTLVVILVGGLIVNCEFLLPTFISESYRYGKFARNGSSLIQQMEVPKSWFRHFYVYSSILSTAALLLMIRVFAFNYTPPTLLLTIFDYLDGSIRTCNVNGTSALLAMSLLTIQCCRRLYDTHFISVFAPSSRMNVSHYIVGLTHYTGAVAAILIEAPKFCNHKALYFANLTYIDILAAGLFLWACWHQFVATKILANLRKDKNGMGEDNCEFSCFDYIFPLKFGYVMIDFSLSEFNDVTIASVVTYKIFKIMYGRVKSQSYKLPSGDWFDYVSSPHNLAEILMYFALTIILWNSSTWIYIFAWVFCNQVSTASLTHIWYQATFKDIPKDRKVLIPFLY